MRSRWVLTLGLVVLAGCLVTPTPVDGPATQDQPVTVILNNSVNTTHTFEVWVVDVESPVAVQRDDGKFGNYSVDAGIASRSSGEYHTYTGIEFGESARRHGRYTLAPGEETRTSIEAFSPANAVVIVPYRSDGTFEGFVSSSCDDELTYVAVTLRSYGTDSAYICR
ncbi:hypothetical protein ACFQH6_03085 [Halobacteriaceae archaeon GCM10025711]